MGGREAWSPQAASVTQLVRVAEVLQDLRFLAFVRIMDPRNAASGARGGREFFTRG